MELEGRKEISARVAVKAMITGYIAYGILIGFVIFVLGVALNWWLSDLPAKNERTLAIVIPIIGVILLYYILHFICKLSIFDVFRKCKINSKNMPIIISRMNLFILICVAFYVITSIILLNLNFNNQEQSILLASKKYGNIHSAQFTATLTREMVDDYNISKQNIIISTIILELGMVGSWFSIIPLQRKLILEYNGI